MPLKAGQEEEGAAGLMFMFMFLLRNRSMPMHASCFKDMHSLLQRVCPLEPRREPI